MPEVEKFWRYTRPDGTVGYHRGKKWRGILQEEATKEEYVQYQLKRIEGVKNSTLYSWTPECKRNAIAKIVEELKELGVEVKA